MDGSANKVDLDPPLQHSSASRPAECAMESKPLGVGVYLSLGAFQAAADHCMAWPVQHPTQLLT